METRKTGKTDLTFGRQTGMFRETQPLLEPPLVIIFVNSAAIFWVFFFLLLLIKSTANQIMQGFFFLRPMILILCKSVGWPFKQRHWWHYCHVWGSSIIQPENNSNFQTPNWLLFFPNTSTNNDLIMYQENDKRRAANPNIGEVESTLKNATHWVSKLKCVSINKCMTSLILA